MGNTSEKYRFDLKMRVRRASLESLLLLATVAMIIECTIASSGTITKPVTSTGKKTTVSYGGGLRNLLNDCSTDSWNNSGQEEFFEKFRDCVYHRALTAFDAVLNDDVIPLFDGLDLVMYRQMNPQSKEKESQEDGNLSGSFLDGGFEKDSNWNSIIWNRIRRVLQSHVFKVDLNRLTNGFSPSRWNGSTDSSTVEESKARMNTGEAETVSEGSTDGIFEGRRRRHRRRHHHMMPMMMMGLLLMGSILIPMGFQFLAVLGGKALLLAKMALILSSIQGLKKIATSGVNYGLYHAPVAEGWHERSNLEPGQGYGGRPLANFPSDFNNGQRPFR